MSIHLKKPYKIVTTREKRYSSHYDIPAAECLVVPLREYENEVLCDVRWEDNNGELHVRHNMVFVNDNLIPLQSMLDEKLHDIWSHYYQPESTDKDRNN